MDEAKVSRATEMCNISKEQAYTYYLLAYCEWKVKQSRAGSRSSGKSNQH